MMKSKMFPRLMIALGLGTGIYPGLPGRWRHGGLAGDAVARPGWMTRDGQHEKERHAYHGY